MNAAPELFDQHAEFVNSILREHRVLWRYKSPRKDLLSCACGWSTVVDRDELRPVWDDWARRHVIEIALAARGPVSVPLPQNEGVL